MQHSDLNFEGLNGIELYAQNWLPAASPRAILAIVHGIGEHSSRYETLVNALVEHQYAVYGFDLRGHGQSPGQRGHIDSWQEYRIDLFNFLALIRERHPDRPVFLLGHSMGALISLDCILSGNTPTLAGVILSGTPIEPIGVAKRHLVALAHILSRVYPRFPIHLDLDPSALSRIPEVVRAYENDPWVHSQVSARWGTESLATLKTVKQLEKCIGIPLLMLHGEADRINSVAGARKFFDRVQTNDKVFIGYPGGYHEPHNDLDYQTMLHDLLNWLDCHIAKK